MRAADPFQCLFYPRGVAIIGSMSPGKLGYEIARQMLAGGFSATFAVNPKAQGLGQVPGFAAISSIGQPVDLAVIASPAATVAEVLEECGQAGVGAAAIITSGFSEAGNAVGEEEIKRVARKHGIRFVGPNCAGILNTRWNLAPTLEIIPPTGETAFISQSGALGGAVLSWAEEQGLGFSKFVSYGNRADLDEAELLEYLAGDPESQVVAMYIESVADGRRFMEALEGCARRKPVVAIKAGRSAAGQRAALSHTGSLAGSDAVYDAALRECGAIRAKGVEELFDLCKAFVSLPPTGGRKLAIVTNSGGPGVLAADRAEEVGLSVAEPSPALRSRLAALLPAYCAIRNPIDLTVEGTEAGYRETLSAVLEEYDAALALDVNPSYLDSAPLARGVADAFGRQGKPVVANFMAGRAVTAGIALLAERGIPNYPTGERAVAALGHMAAYHEWRSRALIRSAAPSPLVRSWGRGKGQLPADLLEPAAMAWLRQNGIRTPQFRVATCAAEAAAAAHELGYPVAMKVVSPDVLHKSDIGGVVLDIRDDDAAQGAFERIRQAAAGRDFRGCIITPMVRNAQEVLVGLSRDPQFGPVVASGLGGIYTEILHDVSIRVAPVDREDAMTMIGEIRSARLLTGARGQTPGNVEALAEMIAGVSRLPFRYPQIQEIDLNPVFVTPEAAIVGDVRIILNRRGGVTPPLP